MKEDEKNKHNAVLSQDELERMRKLSLFKIGAMIVFAAVVIVFGSIAWFTMNREVEGTGTQMTATDLPFEIASKGTAGIRYQSYLVAADDSNKVGETTVVNGTTYYHTSGSTDKIMLRYDTNVGESEIGPGGRGQLNLYLVPKDNIDMKAKITLDVQSYAFFDVYDLDANGEKFPKYENNQPVYKEDGITPVYQTTEKLLNVYEVTADMCTLESTEIEALQQSADYLKGHIMFFGGLGYEDSEDDTLTDDDQWYFETPYPECVFEFEQKNAKKGQMYQVPLYWMWPNTLGQIVLKQADTQRNGIPLVKDLTDQEIAALSSERDEDEEYEPTDKELVIQYVKENKDYVLKDWQSMEFTAAELLQTRENAENRKTLSEVVDDMIDDAANTNNFGRLSDCYNAADFAIGKDIAYFIIEVTVENAG